jgi:hypothetical protein
MKKMSNNKIHKIEEVNNHYIFSFNETINKYFVFDKIEKNSNELKVRNLLKEVENFITLI